MKDHFEKFLGLGNATENENDLYAYSYDGAEIYGKARIVVFPSQDEQIRLILSFANRSNIDVIPRGNGSNPVGMVVPNNSIVMSMQGFDRIHVLQAGERWVKVDCGVTIAELNEAIKKAGYRYPLTTTRDELTTVGSLLARNAASRYSQLYGRAIDTVVELEVLDGTGKSFTVTKDFEQYLGNEGTCFVIIRAKLKVVPISPRSADLLFFESVPQALEEVKKLQEQKPLAIEFLDSAAATYLGFNTKPTLIVEWESEQGSLKYERYAQLMQKRNAARRTLGTKGYIHVEDSTVQPDKMANAIAWCINKELPIVAHAGLGIIHPFLKREQEAIRDEWYKWLKENECDVSGQFGYGLRKKLYVPARMKNRLRMLKERYDYNNVLCRGKLYDYV
jgi:FAD/FMN-containing dehydrogenase